MKHLFSVLVMALLVTTVSCKKKDTSSPIKTTEQTSMAAKGGSYTVNPTQSRVSWVGSKPTGKHTGTLAVSEGSLSVKDGKVTGGNFVLDMNSITVTDLTAGNGKEDLEGHLKGLSDDNSDDFFNVREFPTARFEITKVTGLASDPNANSLVYGNLTLKNQTKPMSFKANINVHDGAIKVSTPEFTIDRTEWGIKFMSKTFFDNLKDKFINDEIGLQVNLVASS